MTANEEQEMHQLAYQLSVLTKGTGWEALRYASIGQTMASLSEYCAVPNKRQDAIEAAARDLVNQFNDLSLAQEKALVVGQDIATASLNWDTMPASIDFQPLIDALRIPA
jgi:hypothetical protein